MSIELDTRIWFSDSELLDRFKTLLLTIDSWSEVAGLWDGLRIVDAQSSRSNTVFQSRDEMSTEEILLVVKNYANLSTVKISTGRPIQYFQKNKPETTALTRLGVSVWSNLYATKYGELIDIEGNGEIFVQSVDPYVTAVNAGVLGQNSAVEKNLEFLTNLLQEVSKLGLVTKFKTFSDAGMKLPFNAHFVFYRDINQVIDDRKFLNNIWKNGIKSYDLEPLSKLASNQTDFVFHEWRNQQTTEKLVKNMNEFFGGKTNFDLSFDQIKQSGIFDTYESNKGFMVLDYPYFMNAFLDKFYLYSSNFSS